MTESKSKEIKLNSNVSIDLPTLIESRLLVQANSGGGKSFLLRRLLEQSHGKVQQIVIDLEGEFSTLREKYEYILAGKEGDTPAEPKSAGLLARKLLENHVSTIIDLYELHPQERKRFVRLFLESMINAPKELWHPCMVVIDEAHVFAPEKGESEAMDAVIGLATLGRKRGFCAVLATQRISKLHKDAAAECNNKLIGRTGLDIDMKRAGDELGFNSKDQLLSLRGLEAGEFFAFGPAISKEVIKVKVGPVNTSHPKVGARFNIKVAPPTDKIKAILKKLGDIPTEAKREVETIASLKLELEGLKRHKCPTTTIDPRAIEKASRDKEKEIITNLYNPLAKKFNILHGTLEQAAKMLNQSIENIKTSNIKPIYSLEKEETTISVPIRRPVSLISNDNPQITPDGPQDREIRIQGGALRMLKVLVSRYPMKLSRSQLGTFAKMKPTSGTFGTYLSMLKSQNHIDVNQDNLYSATQEGIEFIGENPQPPQSPQEVISMWRENLSGGARRMFEELVILHPNVITKEELGERTNMSPASGTFGTYLSMLRSNGLIEVKGSGVVLSDNLFI